MNSLSTLNQNNSEILVIDFSGCTDAEMVSVNQEARDFIAEGQKPVKILAIFNERNFMSSSFVRSIETYKMDALNFVVKTALVGLSKPQIMIIKGYNIIHKRNARIFETEHEAMDYLISPI